MKTIKIIDLLNKIANGETFENCKMKFKEIELEEVREYVIYDRLYEEDLNLNDEVEILDNIPSPDNYVPIEKQTKVTPYEPYRCFVEDKDNFTGWKMYQNGKEVCSVDCSRDEEDEFEDIEEFVFGEVEDAAHYEMKDIINQLIKNQKLIINKLKEEGK